MASFEIAVNHLLQAEGGYSDQAADRGGRTRWGITEAVARRHNYGGEMADFPREQALAIYRSDYWDVIHGDDIPDDALATRLLDFAVNAGPVRAIRALQRALRVTDDGIIGQATLNALQGYGSAQLVALITARLQLEQVRHYRDLIHNDKSQLVFIEGWLTRALG